jgi:uncharacterized protein
VPDLVCPKCQSEMRSYERSGLTVDQCTGCRGIFLDRGELEKLVDAEGAYYERFPSGREREHQEHEHRDRDDRRYEERRYDDDRHEHRSGGLQELGGLGGLLGGGSHGGYKHGHRKKHKRESFLSELFD